MPKFCAYRTLVWLAIVLMAMLALAGEAVAGAWSGGFVGGEADHFLDSTGALTLADVRGAESGRFVASNGQPANHGIAKERGAALWLRLNIPVLEGPSEGSWTLWLDEPRVRGVQVYLVGADGATVSDEWRFDRPSEPGGVSTRIPVFAFPAAEISGKTLYLRVASLSSLRATLWLTPSDRFEAQTTRESLLFGALAGALIAVAVYSLSLGAAVGENALVALSFFILSFAVFVLSDRGFVETAIVPGATTFSRALSFGATFWIYLSAILFSAVYLKSPLGTSLGRIAIAILAGLYVVATVFAVIDVVTDHLRLRVYSGGLGLLAIGALIVMGLDAARVAPSRAGLYFLCWLPAICGGLARVALDVFPTALAAYRFSVFGVYPGLAASLLAFAVVSSIETKRRLSTAQRELAVSEQRFHDYSLTASDDFWETDMSGAVTRVLHSARPVVALQRGDNFAEAMERAATLANVDSKAALRAALTARRPFRGLRFEMEPANGEERHIVVSGQPVHHLTDPETAWRGAMSDVTADVTRERERNRERTMIGLGALVGSIAHEINNLLHPIVNLSRLARERATTDAETRRLLGIVTESGKRAGEIVSNVLGLSRVRDETAVVPFGQALNEALQALHTLGGAQVAIDARVETFEGPPVRPTQVFQVISNLTANAARAMNYGGVVKVTYEEIDAHGSERRFRLVVSDTGVGMSDEVKRRAFEPFFTMSGSAGSGLGLSIVRSVVEGMGGGVEIESSSGKGSDVIVTLPLAAAPAI